MRFWLALCLAAVAWGHDAPAQVTVRMHLRPVGGVMRALVRIPLEAVRDVDFPAVEGGYLDVAALAPQAEAAPIAKPIAWKPIRAGAEE